MRKLATSLILASVNAVLVGSGYLMDWTHTPLPQSLSLAAGVIALIVIPLLVLATIVFALRDLASVGSRLQAAVALALALPVGILYTLTSF